MITKDVFIFWVTPLFYESMSWVLKHPNIKLIGATSSYDHITKELEIAKPNIILIENTGQHLVEMIMEYLNALPHSVKIILLGFSDNKLVVYQHEQRIMAQVEDLLSLILN